MHTLELWTTAPSGGWRSLRSVDLSASLGLRHAGQSPVLAVNASATPGHPQQTAVLLPQPARAQTATSTRQRHLGHGPSARADPGGIVESGRVGDRPSGTRRLVTGPPWEMPRLNGLYEALFSWARRKRLPVVEKDAAPPCASARRSRSGVIWWRCSRGGVVRSESRHYPRTRRRARRAPSSVGVRVPTTATRG